MSDLGRENDSATDRLRSGIRGLDVVLGGGFLVNGTYIVMGPPGAGKTIFGNQICFHHVANGKKALYVTLLAESHARMLSHLRGLEFFDPEPIAASLTYVSGYRVLEEGGLAGLLELIRKLIREHKATLLIIDGLVSAESFAGTELAYKKFIHELNALVGFVGTTTFLLTNGTTEQIRPEHTMVDGLVELSDPLVGPRAVREIVVRKFRGSAHLRGVHTFEITNRGVTVYPRLESTVDRAAAERRDSTSIEHVGPPAFERMLGGGVPSGSLTMVLGPSGSGKTTLGLHFVDAAEADAKTLWLGFHETPERVMQKGDALGFDTRSRANRGLLRFDWHPPVELMPDAIVDRLLTTLRHEHIRRLFIDGLDAFGAATIRPRRFVRFFSALANELRALDVTTAFSQETSVLFGPGIEVPFKGLSSVCDNLVFMRSVEYRSELRRVISVLKTRDRAHDHAIRQFTIGSGGISVGEPLNASSEAILSGLVKTAKAIDSTSAAARASLESPKKKTAAKKPRKPRGVAATLERRARKTKR